MEAIARKMKVRKEADPYLQQMVNDLSEAINTERLHENLTKAKLEFLDQTSKVVEHADPSRAPTDQEMKKG